MLNAGRKKIKEACRHSKAKQKNRFCKKWKEMKDKQL